MPTSDDTARPVRLAVIGAVLLVAGVVLATAADGGLGAIGAFAATIGIFLLAGGVTWFAVRRTGWGS